MFVLEQLLELTAAVRGVAIHGGVVGLAAGVVAVEEVFDEGLGDGPVPGVARVETAASLIIDILLKVFEGNALQDVIINQLELQNNPFMGHPYLKLLNAPDTAAANRLGHWVSTQYLRRSITICGVVQLRWHP